MIYEVNQEVLQEAKFNLLPKNRVREKKALSDLRKYIKEAKDLLKSEDKSVEKIKIKSRKGWNLIMGFINIFGMLETTTFIIAGFTEGAFGVLLAGAISIFGNLFGRLIEWAIMANIENQSIKEAKRALKKFDSVIEKTSDAKLKAKYKAQREKIVKQIEKIDLEEY